MKHKTDKEKIGDFLIMIGFILVALIFDLLLILAAMDLLPKIK